MDIPRCTVKDVLGPDGKTVAHGCVKEAEHAWRHKIRPFRNGKPPNGVERALTVTKVEQESTLGSELKLLGEELKSLGITVEGMMGEIDYVMNSSRERVKKLRETVKTAKIGLIKSREEVARLAKEYRESVGEGA